MWCRRERKRGGGATDLGASHFGDKPGGVVLVRGRGQLDLASCLDGTGSVPVLVMEFICVRFQVDYLQDMQRESARACPSFTRYWKMEFNKRSYGVIIFSLPGIT